MKLIKLITIAVGLSYLLIAFLSWDVNPAYWSGWGRLSFLFVLGLLILLGALLYNPKAFIKAAEVEAEKRKEMEAEANRKKGGFQALLQKQLDAAEVARKAQDEKNNNLNPRI